MSLTRAQLLMGNSSQGAVLPGQVQAVKSGSGVSIASDGTISFDASSSNGVVKTNNANAYNNYIWPSSTVAGGQLTLGSGGGLSWVARNFGFGLDLTGTSVKVALPFGTFTDPAIPVPSIGTGLNQAIDGSLYWNSESDQLFICAGGSWTVASYGPQDINEALLSGAYTLYVNPDTGSDVYVTGVYDPLTSPIVTNQMVTAGYTPQKPFKTLQRAALEVARVQAGTQPDVLSFDRFVIQCSAGVHDIDNTPGSSSVAAWTDGAVPTETQLRDMNSSGYAGLILPRGVSIIGEDLRKTVIRPIYVPASSGNIDTDRGSILRVTGGAFFFNFTFKDKLGLASSHHLLDCFSFCSSSDLVDYYSKVKTIFNQPVQDIPVNPGETEIVAPEPPGIPEEDTDGVFGASPYIFNCSVRSIYGICGIYADGSDVTGFKSMVTAQFTGVSLQRDLTCWQRYNPSTKVWGNTIINYNTYISLDPNDLRMDPTRSSFHVKAINGAFIQEVSVFAIGQGVHHWVKSGGEISITNSNSSFGGCAAIATGYKEEAFPQDTNWNVATINLATNMTDQTTVVNNLSIGVVEAGVSDSATVIVLTQPLIDSEIYPGVPQILASKNYTFADGSYLWIENPSGSDWRAPLSAAAWSSASPTDITITVQMENQDGDFPGVGGQPSLAGSKVYIRRLVDNRSLSQRRYSINVTNTDSNTRSPLRDYVLQTTLGSGGGIVGLLPDEDLVIINKSGPVPIGSDPVVRKSQVVLERANPTNLWTSGNFYRSGDTVRYQNKHFTCVVKNSDLVFDNGNWSESYVQMPSDYNAYDFFLNTNPVIYFDNDTDGFQPTTNCGYNLSTCWNSEPAVKAQYTTATDYRGVYQFLVGIGFSDPQIEQILTPTTTADRALNPSSSIDMGGYVPSGAANALANWPVEFRRPSVIRMFGHAWEWAGYLNYTKALPQYQGELSAQNQFTYYFTNKLGGRVYATGFNQEGYFVTAAGLTDLSTGATIGINDIGNPFAGVDIPTYYPQLTVDNLNVTTSLEFTSGCQITGAPIFSLDWYTNFRSATATVPGLITLDQVSSIGFPAGTRLSFNNASPPPGWVVVTSSTHNNATIRILNSSGAAFPAAGGDGGSQSFTTVFTSSRSSDISVATSGSVGDHTLGSNEMPTHYHSYFKASAATVTAGGAANDFGPSYVNTSNAGNNESHGHGFTNPSYSMGNMNFNVRYVDFIVAEKS